MELEIIFAEFGSRTASNQPTFSAKYRLDPTYTSVKKYFPEANLILYTDRPEIGEVYPDVEIKEIKAEDTPFDRTHPKWGGFCCDYYEAKGLLQSQADMAISLDSDLMFVSDEVKTLIPITKKFGVCVPTNERQLVKVDSIYTRGNNGDYHIGEDDSRGNILTYDLWWMSVDKSNDRANQYLIELVNLMKSTQLRAPLQMTRAAWNTGIYPYSMPIQWGVGVGHVGCKNEIILHVGHTAVQDHYLKRRI